jgi:hypothetical protein
MAHNLQDALRYALWSQNIDLSSPITSNGFHHCGAFSGALSILCHRFPCETNEREQE